MNLMGGSCMRVTILFLTLLAFVLILHILYLRLAERFGDNLITATRVGLLVAEIMLLCFATGMWLYSFENYTMFEILSLEVIGDRMIAVFLILSVFTMLIAWLINRFYSHVPDRPYGYGTLNDSVIVDKGDYVELQDRGFPF
jgi:hypothetical protein